MIFGIIAATKVTTQPIIVAHQGVISSRADCICSDDAFSSSLIKTILQPYGLFFCYSTTNLCLTQGWYGENKCIAPFIMYCVRATHVQV